MFGYVMVNKPELKIREMEEYRAYYCGLCRALKEICGVKGQLSLSYDMTLLLTWYKCQDDVLDERSVTKGFYARCIEKSVRDIMNQYVRQAGAIEKYMQELSQLESDKNYNIDQLSGCCGICKGV